LEFLSNTVTILASKLSFRVAATDFRVVEAVLLEATLHLNLIGAVRALSLAITEAGFWNAFTVTTGPFSLRVAATDLGVISRELLEAALSIDILSSHSSHTGHETLTFIRSV
jgi:hypothetical protein